ncbi:MAG TPA: glycosyltransferase family 4 protein [Terracidiphilus sp.]|nr:glycosyltransferase family 4 protein [Terracidiphilus sp.]
MSVVLALVTDAFGGRGGIAQYNRDFLSALASCGHQVTAISRYAPDEVQLPAGIVQRSSHAGRIAYSVAAFGEAIFHRPDIVFCGHIFMAPLAWMVARVAAAKLVIQTHGIDAWSRPSRLVRWTCEQAAIILSVSRFTRARVLDWAAIPPERVLVIPNTVSDCFKPGNGAALRHEWKLRDKKVLLTVGRMCASERYKGQDRVINLLPRIINAGLDVVYVIAGKGDDLPRLERLVHEVGVSDRVRFVGSLPHEKLIEAYRMADLFVMPSTGEGFGIAYLEAMACGTPALGLAASGARDALLEGALGFITDDATLGRSIVEILKNPDVDRGELSRKVQQAFGVDQYRRCVSNAIAILEQTA